MNTSSVQVGTSLAVLAPYLPYGIQVDTGVGPAYILEIDFRGDSTCPIAVMTVDDWENGEGSTEYYDFTHIKPILRPFNQLVTPIEGVVPAVEVAKMMSRPALLGDYELRLGDGPRGAQIDVYIKGENRGAILEEWETMGAWALLKVVNYLRSLHFAVGLPEGSYIPKEESGGSPSL